MGPYTGIDILLGSHLSPHVIQTKLTPRLGSFVEVIEDELNFAMRKDFPTCKGKLVWSELAPIKVFILELTGHRRRMGEAGPE